MTVGQNIREIRLSKNMTQTDLSTRMGYLSNAVISKLENDHMQPNKDHLRRLSIALKVSQARILDVGPTEDEIDKQLVDSSDEIEVPVTEEKVEEIIANKEPIIEEIVEEQVAVEDESLTKVYVNDEEEKVEDEEPSTEEVILEDTSEEVPVEVMTIGKEKDVVKVKVIKNYAFSSTILSIVMMTVIIAFPLLILYTKERADLILILTGSSISIVVLFVKMIMNKNTERRNTVEINLKKGQLPEYESSKGKGLLVFTKLFALILVLAFGFGAYLFWDKLNPIVDRDYVMYIAAGLIGLSTLIKLFSVLLMSTKKVKNKNISNDLMISLSLMLDLIASLGILLYLTLTKGQITNQIVILLVLMNFVSNSIKLICDKYYSFYNLVE